MRLEKVFRKFLASLFLTITMSIALEANAASLDFSDMYSGASSEGLVFSDTLNSLNGSEVTMTGFMAPPLKPSINFFVLTETPMAVCPFCSTDADWPYNMVVVYVNGSVDALPYDQEVTVTGTLDLGSYMDGDTGFVSQVRLLDATVE